MLAQCIEIKNVSLQYCTASDYVKALRDINLAVFEGEFLSIIGPSGCGKSSLLSLVSGLIAPTEGKVTVYGQPVQGPSQNIAYMLQNDVLFNWRTVNKNCMLGLEIHKKQLGVARDFIDTLLSEVGLGERKKDFPHHLSGGQRQRAALVRTLAVKPSVILLDEPFSALDYPTRLRLQNEVYRILRSQQKTTVLVTHDIPEAVAMSDRVIILTKSPGHIAHNITLDFNKDELPLARRTTQTFGHYVRMLWSYIEIQEKGAQ